jgi:hypothetical protein
MKRHSGRRLKREHWVVAGLAGSAAIALASPARAQVNPEAMDRSSIRPGARALGMGGAYLLGAGDPAAAIWNPAAIARSHSSGLATSLTARTDNVDFDDIRKLANSVSDLTDQAELNNPGSNDVAAVQGAFNDLYNLARDAGATPGGAPARLRVSLEPMLALSVGHFGILGYSGGFGDVQLGVTGTTAGTRTVTANGSALALSTVAIPYGRSFKTSKGADIGTFGVSAKLTRGDFAAANFTAPEGVNPATGVVGDITGRTFDSANDTAFDLDLGYISPAFPKLYGAHAAVVVRNVLSPRFNFLTPTQVNGIAVAPTPFTVRQKPQVDLGIGVQKIGVLPLTVAAELHNLTGANGGDLSLHVGAEYRLTRLLALRAGVDDGNLVGGLGLRLGPAQLDLAIGANVQERIAIGLSSSF